MDHRNRISRPLCLMAAFLILALLLTGGCASPPPVSDSTEQTVELHVAAASDLRFAFEELGRLFEEEEGVKVVFQFGSSGNLAQQIANGAPIDLYASANQKFVEDLIDSGDILPESKALYAIGRIVVAVNRKAEVKVDSLDDLLSDTIDHIAIANPAHAPYGLAAQEALESVGLWDKLAEKLVYGENVSQAMQFVQTGNAPVGIIALSVANVPELDYFLVDESLHNPLEQMLGIVSHSGSQEMAARFAAFVGSDVGIGVMESYGFYLPGEEVH